MCRQGARWHDARNRNEVRIFGDERRSGNSSRGEVYSFSSPLEVLGDALDLGVHSFLTP